MSARISLRAHTAIFPIAELEIRMRQHITSDTLCEPTFLHWQRSPLHPRHVTCPLCCRVAQGSSDTVTLGTFTRHHEKKMEHNSWAGEARALHTTVRLQQLRLYSTESAAFPVNTLLPLLLLLSFIHFKYTSSHKVNRLWVSALLYFFFYAGSKMWCFCLCSPKTLADPLSLIPRTLRVLTEWGIFTVLCLESIWYD